MKKCPYCAEEIQDNVVKCRYCGEFLEEKNVEKIKHIENILNPLTKKCPYCAEEISYEATKCKYCGENIIVSVDSEIEQKIDTKEILNENNVEVTNRNNNLNINYNYKSLLDIKFMFDYKGRINRLQYFLGLLSFYLFFGILFFLDENKSSDLIDILFLLMFPAYYFLITTGIKRSHDINNNGWYILIPFYSLYLFFASGDKTKNRFDNL